MFNAEAAYADSILRSALGNSEGCITALRHSLTMMPTYAPANLSMGSVEYQRGRRTRGRRLFLSFFDLPDDTTDLREIIDKAGDFLIQRGAYDDGLELYRPAAARFPGTAVFYQGIGCCAGHQGHHEEAIAASRAALALEPDNQKLVNDLGWPCTRPVRSTRHGGSWNARWRWTRPMGSPPRISGSVRATRRRGGAPRVWTGNTPAGRVWLHGVGKNAQTWG